MTDTIAEIPGVYSIVTTTRAKYFGKVEKTQKGIAIESAHELADEANNPQRIARGYIKGLLYGDNRRIELTDSLVESVTEAPDETRIVRSLESILPDAKKRAQGIMTYKALEDLLRSNGDR